MRAAGWLALASLASSAWSQSGPSSWKLAYHFDEDHSELTLNDLQIGGGRCAIALGFLRVRARGKPVAVVSHDNAATWKQVELREYGRSLFLDGSTGWMVGENGIWKTSDCGLTWTRLARQKLLARAWFLDERRGFAVGAPKRVYETTDGGVTWKRLAAAAEPKSDPDRSVYTWIHFRGPHGVILGFHEPERGGDPFAPPVWMDPERAQRKRQWPALTLMLQTLDGGATWRPSTSSLMGKVTRWKMDGQGQALALVEFSAGFEWPAEVYRVDIAKNETVRVYREKGRVVTDLLFSTGGAWLAAIEAPGTLNELAIPGRVRIARSIDLNKWDESPVDYRAVGRRVMLAQDGSLTLAATDTGMILREAY